MTTLVCQHPAHEGQSVHKRAYADTWEGRREHQLIHRHPAAPPPEPVVVAPVQKPPIRTRDADGLTQRQRDILTRRQAGQTNARIARDLNLDPSTVSTTVARLRARGFLGEAS